MAAVVAAFQTGLADSLTTDQVLDLIFRDPLVKHGLSEFADLSKKPPELLSIYPKVVNRGKGEIRYYLKCLKRSEDVQVLSDKKANPEEIVRQLWLYKLHHVYRYPLECTHISSRHGSIRSWVNNWSSNKAQVALTHSSGLAICEVCLSPCLLQKNTTESVIWSRKQSKAPTRRSGRRRSCSNKPSIESRS
jgi:hypothetical protein